jgi:hypothetical protein
MAEKKDDAVKTIAIPGPLFGASVRLGKEISPGYFAAEVLDGERKGDKLGVYLDQCK